MLDAIIDFFKAIPEIWVLLISMVPFIELRGAIPVGTALLLPVYINLPLAIIGNMIPVPFILLLMPKIMSFLSKFKLFAPFVSWLRSKAEKHKGRVITDGAPGEISNEDKLPTLKMTKGIFFALLLFVGVPLPGTGAWCGSLIASLFNIEKKYSFLAIFLGVVLSGIVMSLTSYGVLGFLNF